MPPTVDRRPLMVAGGVEMESVWARPSEIV
jgi:hypothetical protein